MKAKIEMIKGALAIAQQKLVELKTICPTHFLAHKEIAELEMGLDWTQKRAESLDELIANHP